MKENIEKVFDLLYTNVIYKKLKHSALFGLLMSKDITLNTLYQSRNVLSTLFEIQGFINEFINI